MTNDEVKTNCNEVALVTGASRGIGREIALNLLEDGYLVVGTATTEKGARNIDTYESKSGKACVGIKLDVSQANEVSQSIAEISEKFAIPKVLVNNAGVTRDSLLMRMKENDWDSVLDTNLKGIYHLSKYCLKGMTRARWGRIINITSVVASMGNAGQANYAASKAGVEGFTRSLAREVGPRNITVNCVAPGFIDTDMTRNLPSDVTDSLTKQIPLGRFGHVRDIASLVSFLCSESGSYITGETIQVNGGMYLK
tara:strand:- start:466 stop:1227 length:762 start_codon:yes stop_codon:yes gene_type:complete